MRNLLLTAALPLALSSAAVADGHMAAFPEVIVDDATHFRASNLLGMRVYQSEAPLQVGTPVADGSEAEWDDIGEIGDLIVSRDGALTAVIVDVGGFLGIGEKHVAVTFDQLKVVTDDGDEDDRFLVLTSNRQLLTDAPVFGTSEDTQEEMTRQMLRQPMVERDGYLEARIDELKAEDIQGRYVYGTNDETVGEVDALIMSSTGQVEQAVINVGGFLGIGEKPVAVTFDELKLLKDADGDEVRIYIDATQEELEAQPEYDG